MAGRARTRARGQLLFPAAAARGEGRGDFLWGPTPFGRASLPRLRAPARSPSWNWEEEGEGGRDESRAVVRREAETKRRGSEGAGTISSASAIVFQLFRRGRTGKGGGQGWSGGCQLSDPSLRGAVQPGVLGVGPVSVAEDLGLRPLGPRFWGLAPRFLNTLVSSPRIPDIWDSSPNLYQPGSLFYTI